MLAWYEGTLVWRVLFGVAFFLTLGIADLVRHPEDPRRAREYLFLLAATLVGTAFGVVHDQVTYTLSPEYFRLYKGLGDGGRAAVTMLAVQASYWVGTVAGAALLVANNPGARPQVPYAPLARQALWPLGAAASGAVLGGLALAAGIGSVVAETTFGVPARDRMQLVWGVHLGAYSGGALGVFAAVAAVRRRRACSAAADG